MATSDQSIDLTAPSTAGTYYYGACVDAVTDESDTTDNCSDSVTVTVTVTAPAPDLTVTLSISVPAGGFIVGSSFQFGATVRTNGDGSSAATTLRYYQSADAPIRSSDTELGTDAVVGLAASGAGSISQGSIDVTVPSTPGRYYYNACVDAVEGESNTTNNCSLVSIGVTVIPEPEGPDLRVYAIVVSGPPSGNPPGGSINLSAGVGNYGDESSAATTLRYYRSTDATITTSDTSVGTSAVWSLGVGATSSVQITLTLPSSAGTYYYGACVDAVADESDTTNNCSVSVGVDVE